MGPVSRIVLYGCLTALQYLLWLVGVLLLILIVAQFLRGEDHATPGVNLLLAGAFALAGALCGMIGRRLQPR